MTSHVFTSAFAHQDANSHAHSESGASAQNRTFAPRTPRSFTQTWLEVTANQPIAAATYQMVLSGNVSAISQPGQFVNIKIPGFSTRRPLSVCNVDFSEGAAVGFATIIYKVVGAGTAALAKMPQGTRLNCLVGLGNGFDISKAGSNPVLIGGGVGVPPLFLLARRLIDRGAHPTVILGFGSRAEVFYEDEFRALGARVLLTTADGSAGQQGFVTAVLPQVKASYIYACGPHAMLTAVAHCSDIPGEFSFEERMGCGFGACMGCVKPTVGGGYKRVCVEGPVIAKEEIAW
ncbi:MAG: dihydroorotate dehydrogenase electron transfer subunit [Actinomycetaceae bacterium]|nr:dihydroorotate dehydrogenase electron transfer subunit [Actinomycetaceae bacterium]